jgi:hypothetical protein
MKKILSLSFWLLIVCSMTNAQNVGVGTTTPTEKLDVNGNVNVNGQLKLNGSAGTANQVMMKDASNNPVWGNLSNYQNIAVFDCNNTATSPGANNCTQIWTVPAGVTSILVECWGGGGGGGWATAGAGGGYITAKINVAPLSNASLTIGAGGGNASSATYGVTGGTTSFGVGAISLIANGGAGGNYTNLLTSSGGNIFPTPGGDFTATNLGNNFYGLNGSGGGYSERSFTQVSTNVFAPIVRFGNGGDAGNAVGSGAKGGYYISTASFTNSCFGESLASQPGGGGSADETYGYPGRGGRIIIRW